MKRQVFLLFILSQLASGKQPVEWALTSKKDGWVSFEEARNYHQNNDIQQIWAEMSLARINLKEYTRILDYGCGDGKISSSIAIRNSNSAVLGVDISSGMIAFAKLKYRQKNLEFSDDIDKITGPFDLIVSFNVLHLVPDAQKIVQEFSSWLKPGGYLVLAYPSGDKFYLESVKKLMEKYKLIMPGNGLKDGKLRLRNPDDARKILESNNFTIKFLHDFPDRVFFVDNKDFIEWSNGTISKNFGLPLNLQNQFHSEFIELYKAGDGAAGTDGGFAPRINHLEIVAVKQ